MGLPVPLNIAVVDDHELIRLCFHHLLRDLPYVASVLQLPDGEAYEAACASGPPVHLAIVGVHPPRILGLAALTRIATLHTDTLPVAYVHSEEPFLVRRAMYCGARTVWNIRTSAQAILQSLEQLRTHGHHVNEIMRAELDRTGRLLPMPTPENIARLFTDREREFISAFCATESHSMADVAAAMGIKEGTACDHRKAVYATLEVNNMVELYRVAVMWKLDTWVPPVKRRKRT